MMKKRLVLMAMAGLLAAGTVQAQRVTDKVDRGVVAVPMKDGGYLVTWRMYGEEYYDTKYNLYQNGKQIASNLTVTNYAVAGGKATDSYQVEAVVKGVPQEKSAAVSAWANNYFDVKVLPVVNRAGNTIANSVAGNTGGEDTTTKGYTLNDVSLADVDGDGVAEFIVKRNNNLGNRYDASNKTDFNLYECYKIDGTRLWWIDLGPNMNAGADEQWDMIGYDWDRDGKAEVLMRGADNMIIHTATGKTINVGNMNYYAPRSEYTHQGAEYLLYLNGETGEPYLGWDGGSTWTPMAFPLPRFEQGEAADPLNATDAEYKAVWGDTDTGHRSLKIYMGAPYLDGRNPSIFLGRGCYTRHKFCALDVNPTTHEITQRWRWNCYDSKSPWFGNGFHNFAIADVDMDGRDEIMFGSMTIDDTGYGLATTGLGHGDAQHCGDLDPYRWGLEQFTCQEGSEGNSYWNPTTGQVYYRKSDGGDDGRALAGNFSNDYPGGQGRSVSSGVIGLSCDKVINVNGDAMSGNYANLNNRIYWDGDLLDEIFNSKNGANRAGTIFKWGGSVITNFEAITNNWTKCNPSAQGDILGDWREELVLRLADNSALRIYTSTYPTDYGIYTLWHDHQYRNGMAWQCVGYNQPPHLSYFLGELENITIAPPPLLLRGRTEVANGATIKTTDDHLLMSGYENMTVSVQDGASPYILTVNAPAWVKGSGSQQAVASTPKSPARTVENYVYTLTGGAFSGATRLVKQGEGTLVLPSVTEKHTGRTDVWNGTLCFDGTMEQSPVWLNRHTTLISEGGRFMAGLKADYNATVYPGGQDKVGSITASQLDLGFGSRIVFDNNGSAVDQVNATKLTIEVKTWEFGPKYKMPVFQFLHADQLKAGKYELGTVAQIEGNIRDILLEGISDYRFYLSHENGKLYLVLEELRSPASVVWNGTTESSVWDLAESYNFLNNGQADYAAVGDDILFDDQAQSTNVTVKGAVAPKSITFNNETKDYVFTGDSILGGGTITKNGAGRVTINTENRTGATTINAGTLVVNALANNTGVTYGALGDVRQTITINDGATLSVSQPVITDQQINVSGNATISVPNYTMTVNKGLKGAGATVRKTGNGTLTTGTQNTYARLVIVGGRVNAVASGNVDQLPATVEFQNGILWGANMEDTPGITNNANFEVPEGKTGTFYGSFRGYYNGKLTGKGTFNVYTGGVRCYWNGDWSEFEGTIVPGKYNRQNKKSYDPSFNITNSKGMPKATLKLEEDMTVSNNDPANSSKYYNVEIGHVSGSGTLAGSGTYTIGGDGQNSIGTFKATAPVVKNGAGYLRLMTPGNLSSTMTVAEGELQFNDTKMETPFFGGVLTVKEQGHALGRGLISALTVENGGQVTPRSVYSATTPAAIKMSAATNFKAGSVLNIYVKSKTSYGKLEATFLTMNGTVRVTLDESYQPAVGDELTIWTAARTFSGKPAYELPQLPEGLYWDVTGLANATGVLRITDDPSMGIGRLPSDAEVLCDVYAIGGVRVATLRTSKGRAAAEARRQGLGAGTYILKMTDGHRVETGKVVVR